MKGYENLEKAALMTAQKIKSERPELTEKECGKLAKEYVIGLYTDLARKITEQGG